MKFNVNQQDLQQALNYCQGVIEKRSTLPILSNVLLDVSNSNLTITATDLDLIFIHQINNVEVIEEGSTTTTSSTMYDIIRKFSSGKKINLSLTDSNKLQVESEKSIFKLNCISASEFPLTDENFNQNEFSIKSKQLLKLLNKCKFSVSNDETRHYLSGIFFHQTEIEDKNFLTAAATDSHRMSISKIRLDKKDGVKFNLSNDVLNLSVNNTNSGDGKESLNVKFDYDLEISFNSRYLIDVASQLDGDKIEIFFNDTGSPALIKDPGDFDSIFVVMPMKG